MPYEHNKYAVGSHRQLRGGAGANAHEVNLRKKKFDEFIENARNEDLRRVIEKNQENQKKKQLADFHRSQQRVRAIQESHAASVRNDKEGRMKELQRATNQYEGLEKSDLCRNCRRTTDERYDFYHDPHEYGYDDDDDPGYVYNPGPHHNPLEWIEDSTVCEDATANKLRHDMDKLEKNAKFRNRKPRY